MEDIKTMSEIRLLIVEDSDLEYTMMARTLEQTYPEISIERVRTLFEAQEAIENGLVDIVVLDLTLPDADLPEVLKFIEDCPCAVAIYSASTDHQTIMATAKAGALCFVCKGTPANQLAAGLLFAFEELRRSAKKREILQQRLFDLCKRIKDVPLLSEI